MKMLSVEPAINLKCSGFNRWLKSFNCFTDRTRKKIKGREFCDNLSFKTGIEEERDEDAISGLQRELYCDRLNGFVGKTCILLCNISIFQDWHSIKRLFILFI